MQRRALQPARGTGGGADRQRATLARTGDALAVQREIVAATRASASRPASAGGMLRRRADGTHGLRRAVGAITWPPRSAATTLAVLSRRSRTDSS